jgi:hypothetical protein
METPSLFPSGEGWGVAGVIATQGPPSPTIVSPETPPAGALSLVLSRLHFLSLEIVARVLKNEDKGERDV